MISAVMIIKDAEATLADTLAALTWCAEVIVYDTGSRDHSQEIASRYANVRWVAGFFDGFGATKNRALDTASNDWIFSIDADEIPDATLIANLQTFPLNDPNRVGIITRENQFYGQTVTVGGWGKDQLLRIFHRSTHRFNSRPVHESVEPGAQSEKIILNGALIHAAVTDVGQFLIKIERYSALNAERLAKKPFPLIVGKAVFAFLRSYFLKRGFLAGWRGVTIAWCNATGVYFKYLRAYLK